MTTTPATATTTPAQQQAEEMQRLQAQLAQMQDELAAVQDELAATLTRIAAYNRHVFTLRFPGGQIAILEVRGAADQGSARTIAQQAVRHRRRINTHGETIERAVSYTVSDGDATKGRAEYFYYWCTAAAQERQPLHSQQKEAQA